VTVSAVTALLRAHLVATSLLETKEQARTDQQPNAAADEEGRLHLQQVLGTDTSAYRRKWLKIYNAKSKVYNLED